MNFKFRIQTELSVGKDFELLDVEVDKFHSVVNFLSCPVFPKNLLYHPQSGGANDFSLAERLRN